MSEKRPAVFFDRDGVLNIDKGYVYRPEDFVWMPGAKAAIAWLNRNGYYVFVITNQSGVARGYYTEEDVKKLHDHMNDELAREGAHIDEFFYCPHHEEAAIEAYRKKCDCRKPQPGLIRQAMAKWTVDKESSFVVGDKPSDIEAATAAGVPGFLFDGTDLYSFLQEKK